MHASKVWCVCLGFDSRQSRTALLALAALIWPGRYSFAGRWGAALLHPDRRRIGVLHRRYVERAARERTRVQIAVRLAAIGREAALQPSRRGRSFHGASASLLPVVLDRSRRSQTSARGRSRRSKCWRRPASYLRGMPPASRRRLWTSRRVSRAARWSPRPAASGLRASFRLECESHLRAPAGGARPRVVLTGSQGREHDGCPTAFPEA